MLQLKREWIPVKAAAAWAINQRQTTAAPTRHRVCVESGNQALMKLMRDLCHSTSSACVPVMGQTASLFASAHRPATVDKKP
jgi:hypothetical protein